MHKISYLVGGVADIHRRSFYPKDTIRCFPNVQPAQLHKYNGFLTNRNDAQNETTYRIDDVVEYTTVLEETRQNIVKELDEGKNAGTVTMLLAGGTGVVASTYAYINFIDVFTTGGVLTAVGCVAGLAVGYWRRRQFSDELDKWQNQLDQHMETRKSLPKLRTNVINNLGYIGQYLTPTEVNLLWRSDLTSTRDKLRGLMNGDLQWKLKCVHAEIHSSPLEISTVKSCGINGDDLTVTEEQTEFSKLKTEYDVATNSYSQRKKVVDLGNELATEKTNHRYDTINSTMDGTYVYDMITGRRVWHSIYCDCNDCVLKNTFYAATRTVTEYCRDESLRSIIKKYNTEMSEVVAEYNSQILPMVDRLEKIYTTAITKLE